MSGSTRSSSMSRAPRDLILEPFLRDAPEALWPGFIIVEDSRGRWQSDLPALLESKGYKLIAQTRLNLVYERASA
jgi:hypothetical protein